MAAPPGTVPMAYRDEYSSPTSVEVPAGPRGEQRTTAPAGLRPDTAPQPASAVAEPVLPVAEPAGKPGKQSGSRRRIVIAAVLAAALGFGGYEGYGWWTT